MTELRAITRAWYDLGIADRELFEASSEHIGHKQSEPQGGLSPELFRSVVRAAMKDVEAIADRLAQGEDLLGRYRSDPSALSDEDRFTGAALDQLARTGIVPDDLGRDAQGRRRRHLPGMLFVTRDDLTPIMVLLAARTGRNSETIKELSAVHRVREGLVLETQTIKRRQGYESETATWEIGASARPLKTAGGLYLLLERLCRRARALSSSDALLCAWFWRRGVCYPWARTLESPLLPNLPKWAKKHGFQEDGASLRLTINRIKTTVDRDRAMKNNFDLDRAAITNTPTVLYTSYVSPDASARRALQTITNGALVELDKQLTSASSPEKTEPISARPPIAAEPDAVTTAFMHCRNVLGHPSEEGIECTATILDCFGCPCAVVSDEHIPTILRLSEEMVERFSRYPLDAWVQRFGQAWLAIHNDILPSRTAHELADAAARMPDATALTLLDDPEMF
ncbi:hypothetical protein [Curtobacterium flaccumfaciens]|uniref:hypothetical protein n=1 Tax=Curtobacterium flaccumfaciens TaxID=2035 RepID=UPI001BDECF48|nr:hypothetical protein [Curtobacterium flaccumfaciens]MBT1631650.1 hypothetical protein [Curtobacterium flaccumfaciens pv. oortii]MCX2844162.1 hypothetical protein [Curtobacterium flaccumfaciens pv. oortii]